MIICFDRAAPVLKTDNKVIFLGMKQKIIIISNVYAVLGVGVD